MMLCLCSLQRFCDAIPLSIEVLFQRKGLLMNVGFDIRRVLLCIRRYELEVAFEVKPIAVHSRVELVHHGCKIHRIGDDIEVAGCIVAHRIDRMHEQWRMPALEELLEARTASSQVRRRHARRLFGRKRLGFLGLVRFEGQLR